MIPEIIHYCWLSDDPVPAIYQKYVNSWKIKLPAYQFVLWDRKRFDLNKTLWTRQAFDTGMYACASDYVRLYAVYNYGGIYLDMDMEIIKPFGTLLDNEIMLADETPYQKSLEAGCFGAIKGHPYIKKCMEYFESNHFFDPAETENILNMPASKRYIYISPLILPEIMKYVLELFFREKRYKIYPWKYFTAKNVVTGVIEKTRDTYTVHHFATQYHSEEWRKNRETEQKIKRFFGENTKLSKMFLRAHGALKRFKRHGFLTAMRYYIGRFILHNRDREKIDF
jgi:mannosyltransferase OCH1-like enzyme/ribosomal protein L34